MDASMECTTDPTNPRTGVFWNFNDYPIIKIADPVLVRQKIERAVSDEGYNSRDLSIQLWGYYDDNSEKLLQIYSTTNIPITFRRMGDKIELVNVNNMIVNILLWALDNPGANIMVLSKYIGEKKEYALENLHSKEYTIHLSDPPDLSDVFLDPSLGWLVKVLSPPPVPKSKRQRAEKKQKMPQSAGSSDLVTLFSGTFVESVSTKWDDFSHASQKYTGTTLVFWDVEDSSILRKVDPLPTYVRITEELGKKGYNDYAAMYAFVEEFDPLGDELFESFSDLGISFEQTPKGAQTSRSCALAQLVLLFALNEADPDERTCMLLLSKNKDLQTVVNALKKHHINAGLVDPDEFLIMKLD